MISGKYRLILLSFEILIKIKLFLQYRHFIKPLKFLHAWSKLWKKLNLRISKRKKSSCSRIRFNHSKISSTYKKMSPYLPFPWKKSSRFCLLYGFFKTLKLCLHMYLEKKTVNRRKDRSKRWFLLIFIWLAIIKNARE